MACTWPPPARYLSGCRRPEPSDAAPAGGIRRRAIPFPSGRGGGTQRTRDGESSVIRGGTRGTQTENTRSGMSNGGMSSGRLTRERGDVRTGRAKRARRVVRANAERARGAASAPAAGPHGSPAGSWCVLEGELVDVLVGIASGGGVRIRLLAPPAPGRVMSRIKG